MPPISHAPLHIGIMLLRLVFFFFLHKAFSVTLMISTLMLYTTKLLHPWPAVVLPRKYSQPLQYTRMSKILNANSLHYNLLPFITSQAVLHYRKIHTFDPDIWHVDSFTPSQQTLTLCASLTRSTAGSTKVDKQPRAITKPNLIRERPSTDTGKN